MIPHCSELEVHHTNGSGVLLYHGSHSPLMCCEIYDGYFLLPNCLAAGGVYDPVTQHRIHPTQAVGQKFSLHWEFWIFTDDYFPVPASLSPLPELAKACISTPVVSDDKVPSKGPHAKVSSVFFSDATFYSESTLLTFCSWCPGHELCPEVS